MWVDKRLLVNNFGYEEFISIDRNHNPVYKQPVKINHCRIDFGTSYSKNKSEETKSYSVLIFCFGRVTKPFIDFKERSRINIDGQNFIINKVIPIYEPYKNKLFSYEIEAI